LKRRQEERLGWEGIQFVKAHPWLADVDWERMNSKRYPSPFIPNLNERNYDTVSVSEYEDDYLERLHQNSLLLRKKEVQEFFEGYEY
jgi:serum/glucocorticoid-regulated kinase 2